MRDMREKKDIVKVIQDKILNVIVQNSLIKNGDSIVVGVSGGPDSMCLLDCLINLRPILEREHNVKYNINVAHVNHMIRKESFEEKEYVEKFCKDNNVEFYYKQIDIPKLSKQNHLSEEMCGREERYKFFEEVRIETDSSKIAVAHNLDDNVETILLNLIRGCGLKGLIGMKYITKNIIRPMIDIEKKDILEYNTSRDLNPCFDKTNEIDIYTRNKIRLNLIPKLKNEYNLNILENIIRMKHILELDEEFLDNYTTKIVEECLIKNTEEYILFDYKRILQEHDSIKKRGIRKIIELKCQNVDKVENIHVEDILKLMEKGNANKQYILGSKFKIEILKKGIAKIC